MAAALPRTLGELQLYRILQRANLLCYYEAFIQQGGDDVQQLCEAGEDEFLEIMALVGMASKPLHVRRLQKALRDWVTNPALFSQPRATPVCSVPVYKPVERAGSDSDMALDAEPAPASPRSWAEPGLSPAEPAVPGSPLEVLDTAAVRSVTECVTRLAQTLPKVEPAEVRDLLKGNKKLAKMVGHIFDMTDEDPQREEEVRKYSAIYGRFDSKRRDGKQLTLHELTVNEAAAQLCMRNLALLTRRDELFSLARQVSREVTYKYTYQSSRPHCGNREDPSSKRIKTEEGVFDLHEAMQQICTRQEMLKERLAPVTPTGGEAAMQSILTTRAATAGCLPTSLTQMQLERLLAKQMEVLQDAAARERLHTLNWMLPPRGPKPLPQHLNPNGVATDKAEQQAEQLPSPRVSGLRWSITEGELPLGRQLASELKRRHSLSVGRAPPTSSGEPYPHHATTPLPMAEEVLTLYLSLPPPEQRIRTDSLQGILNLSEVKKTIKVEPEDSR
uniref:NGFI-A binding protein 1b (EGR1 binding protein 1) n=1 Tax=Paramormyrops kingsleyae TaxID=1676925 RepID=A0A3B3T220_9TELE